MNHALCNVLFARIRSNVFPTRLLPKFTKRNTWQVVNKLVPAFVCPTSTILCRRGITNQNFDEKKEIQTSSEQDRLYRAIDIYVKGHEKAALESYMTFCQTAAEELNITVSQVLTPKFIADRMTLLRSKHIYKKHRVQYEIRTHKKVLQVKFLTGSTADVFLEYIQRNLPAGVAMRIHRFELERIPKHICEEIAKKVSELTDEDWKREAELMEKCKEDRNLDKSFYEEHNTTKRFLLGRVS